MAHSDLAHHVSGPASTALASSLMSAIMYWGAEHGGKWEIAEIADSQFFDKWANLVFSVRWWR